jgi:hypothetical protein
MLDQDAITELRIPEDPTNLQAKARKILGETLVRELGVPNTANKWLDANPDPNSVALEAKQALAVLHINNLGHCSIAWLMGLGGVEFYGHYKIAPDEKATAEQMANRAAWMGSMTL